MSEQKRFIVLGGGCFWCLDGAYRMVRGISTVTSGYSGGHIPNPSTDRVYMGDSGHAEVVQLEYDPRAITLEDILDVFWAIHDPTTLNRQMHDVGPEYRSIIFYKDEAEHKIIERSLRQAQKFWQDPIVTEVMQFKEFYSAEDFQQDFFANNPDKAYCQFIINPKLTKLRAKYAKLLKS